MIGQEEIFKAEIAITSFPSKASIGKFIKIHPSTYKISSICFGAKTPGKEILALIAS
jgi:hypothetical protein